MHATEQARQDLAAEVVDIVKSICDVDEKSLSRRQQLSPDINFEEAVATFEQIFLLFHQIQGRNIAALPTQALKKIKAQGDKTQELIGRVRDFKLDDEGNPASRCRDIINAVQVAYDPIAGALIEPIAYLTSQSTDLPALERQLIGVRAKFEEDGASTLAEISRVKEEAEQAMKQVKAQAAEAGVSSNAEIYDMEAKELLFSSRIWLGVTIGSLIVTVGVAVYFMTLAYESPAMTTSVSINVIGTKLIIISLLTFLSVFFSKNYRATRHNFTLYRHRANALRTFKAFTEGTSDDSVKDAVLLHAADASFSMRGTGYDSTEKIESAPNTAFDLVRKLLPASVSSSQ